MKARMLALAAVAALTVALSTSAQAQFEVSDKSRFGISLAFLRPSGSEFRDMGGTWLGPTLQVNVGFDKMDRPSTFIGFTWYGKEEGSRRANFFPLTGTFIRRFGADRENPWYAGGGAGIYFVNYKSVELGNFGYTTLSDDKIEPGVHYVIGKEYGGFYVEFRQDLVSPLERSNGSTVRLSGWALSVGTRLAL